MKKQLIFTLIFIMILCLLGINKTLMAQTDRILHFDGTDDYVNIFNNTAIHMDASFTIEAWFLINEASSGGGVISSHKNDGSRSGYAIEYNGTDIKGLIGFGGGWEIVSEPVNKNQWYHIAFVFEKGATNNNLLLYIDGVLVNSISTTNDKEENTSDVWIGGTPNYSGGFWKGGIDEVRIWNTVRTESQINANKDIELNGTETGLVAYYNFNQGTPGGNNTGETTLIDNGPNAFNGTLTNFALQECSSNWLNTIITLSPSDVSISNPNTTIIVNGEYCNITSLYEIRYGHICSLQDNLTLLTPGILKTEYTDSSQTQFTSEFTGLDRSQNWYVRAYAIIVENGDTIYNDIDTIASFGHSPLDPIVISQPSDLDSIRNRLDDATLYFRLVNDIDLSNYLAPGGEGYAKWGNDGWLPIGTDTARFKATFYGGGYTISGLVINRPTSDYIGLFGYTFEAEIDSLHIIDANVEGNAYVGTLAAINNAGNISYCSASGTVEANTSNCGGLLAWNSGTVSECYANTDANTPGDYIGGLIGYSNGLVKNSYAHGDVSASGQYCGGFIGRNEGNIDKCYSAGLVSGTASDIGGFVGANSQTVSNSFWDTETSGTTISNGGTGKTTSEMRTLSTFTDAGWDFVNESTNGTEDLWNINLVQNNGSESYPFLEKNKEIPVPGKNVIYAFAPGSGDGSSPAEAFLVENKTQLNNVRHMLGAYYRQIADIVFTSNDFQAGGQFYNSGGGWIPIGDNASNFTGSYNGDGYNIDSLYMNHSSGSSISDLNGFFYETDNARIDNVNLRDVNIQGDYIGGFVCVMHNTKINNCSISGSMSGIDYSGSFFVYAYTGGNKISNCTSTVDMTKRANGNRYSGFGQTLGSSTDTIINCSYNGEINTNGYGGIVSGFIYENHGYISNCSASGSIISEYYTSGFVSNNYGFITDSHSDMDINCSNSTGNVAGFTRYNYNNSEISRCYSSGTISGNFQAAAGFVYHNSSKVEYCYSLTDISGNNNLAGFVYENKSEGNIKRCYSRGSLTRNAGSTEENLSAFAIECTDALSSINYCYTTSSVQYTDGGTPVDKGFVLNAGSPQNFHLNYFDKQATGQNLGTGATGLTTAEMKTEDGLSTWNFYDAGKWKLDSLQNDAYPIFRDTTRVVTLNGSGTAADPYIIDHWSKLWKLNRDTSLWHSHFIQTTDVEFPYCIREWNNGHFPLRIGNSENSPFTGSYDGQNYAITNFYTRSKDNYCGLFSYVEGAELKNIFLYADISVGIYSAILCHKFKDGYMENCHTYGNISGGYAAGLAIGIENSTVINCGNNASITAIDAFTYDEHRLIGFIYYAKNSNLTQCYNKGDFIGNNHNFYYSAGFAHSIENNSNILKCYNEGSVSGFKKAEFASFIYELFTNSTVDQCYTSGTIDIDIENTTQFEGVSSFIGSTVDCSIKNCYSTVNIQVDSVAADYEKFINNVNSTVIVENCYYAGHITIPDTTTDIILTRNYTTNSFADTSLTKISQLNGLIGKSTDSMKIQSTFTDAGWDFVCETTNGTEQIWAMNGVDNDGYPYLAWQGYTYENEAPVITSSHNNQQIYSDANCQAALPDYTTSVTATDNCDLSLDTTQIPLPGTLISGTTNTVSLIVTDDNNNADTVQFNVAVVDTTIPTITCVGNQEVTADNTNTYIVQGTVFDPTDYDDNCGVASIENDFNNTETLAGAELPEGTTTIVWTVTDNAGNENTCSFDVVVNTYSGIGNIFENTVGIYPNPFSDNIKIDKKNHSEKIRFEIINTIGQIIYQGDVIDKTIINTSGFKPGVYIIKLENDNTFEFRRLIKQ